MDSSQKPAWRALILPITAFILVTAGLLVGINAIGVNNIRQTIESAGPLAPLLFIGAKIATYVFAPLTSGPIQLVAGIMFGLWPGTFYTLVGEVIGGSISFMIARRFGRPVVRRFVGDDGMAKVDRFYHQSGEWRTLLAARLLLFSIWDFLSYAAGLTPVKYVTYLWVSIVGGFFPTFIAVALGDSMGGEVTLLYVGLLIVCLIPLVLQKQIRRWLKMDAAVEDTQPLG